MIVWIFECCHLWLFFFSSSFWHANALFILNRIILRISMKSMWKYKFYWCKKWIQMEVWRVQSIFVLNIQSSGFSHLRTKFHFMQTINDNFHFMAVIVLLFEKKNVVKLDPIWLVFFWGGDVNIMWPPNLQTSKLFSADGDFLSKNFEATRRGKEEVKIERLIKIQLILLHH